MLLLLTFSSLINTCKPENTCLRLSQISKKKTSFQNCGQSSWQTLFFFQQNLTFYAIISKHFYLVVITVTIKLVK